MPRLADHFAAQAKRFTMPARDAQGTSAFLGPPNDPTTDRRIAGLQHQLLEKDREISILKDEAKE